MSIYYNEIDEGAVAWLRTLMAQGQIPEGDIDTRSIEDVTPNDVRGYTHAHFFAGIGGWARALQLAGWPQDRPVWTASCPCQPFSQAGKGAGTGDGRHLWPAVYWLACHVGPPVLFGEQVASPAGRRWLAGVRDDMEALGYAVGASDLCAPGVGAFHARQRLYFVALSRRERRERERLQLQSGRSQSPCFEVGRGSEAHGVADALGHERGQVGADLRRRAERGDAQGLEQRLEHSGVGSVEIAGSQFAGRGLCGPDEGARADRSGASGEPERSGGARGVSDAEGDGRDERTQAERRETGRELAGDRPWVDVEWIECLDGLARPVESLAEPLADGLSDQLGYRGAVLSPLHAKPEAKALRLRGYGNAIVPQLAATFIQEAL